MLLQGGFYIQVQQHGIYIHLVSAKCEPYILYMYVHYLGQVCSKVVAASKIIGLVNKMCR